MKSDRSKIAHLSIPPGRTSGILCRPLDLRFPTVYRVVQAMTREELDEHGLRKTKPFAGYNHYTLIEDDERFPGTITRTMLRVLDPAVDRVSLVIRHHCSAEEALAYHEALEDYGVPFDPEPVCRTDAGIFTLTERPTKPRWPGPLIIYCVADVPADNVIGRNSWEVAMAPDGTLIEPFADFSHFDD
jgi:hypothetical protein